MVLTEAWAAGKPVLVQGRSEVLRNHARRSGGALCFQGWAEFMAAVEVVLANPSLGAQIGAAGKDYVDRNYSWKIVMDRYEELLLRSRRIFEDRGRA